MLSIFCYIVYLGNVIGCEVFCGVIFFVVFDWIVVVVVLVFLSFFNLGVG